MSFGGTVLHEYKRALLVFNKEGRARARPNATFAIQKGEAAVEIEHGLDLRFWCGGEGGAESVRFSLSRGGARAEPCSSGVLGQQGPMSPDWSWFSRW